MPYEREINSIVEQVKPWPQEHRAALAYEILRDVRRQTREPAPRRTLEHALGVAKGTTPPPDDATVTKWIEEHRIRKHG